jgi:hypothetical protein
VKSYDTSKAWNVLVKSTFYVMVYTIFNLVLTLSRQIPIIKESAVSFAFFPVDYSLIISGSTLYFAVLAESLNKP